MATESEDDYKKVSDPTPQADSDNSNKSRDHITKNFTVIPVLIYHTGFNSPMIVHSLDFFGQKKNRYDKENLGTIRKREYENDVVWITIQSHQFKRNKVTISKVKGYEIDLMSIFYVDSNNSD